MKKNKKFIFEKLYNTNISIETFEKVKKIKLLILDVDGVLSNGLLYIGNNNEETKSFNVKDNYGIRCLLSNNIDIAIITGRKSNIIKYHCKSLGIKYLFQGELHKLNAFNSLLNTLSLSNKELISYIGDDVIDLPVMQKVGLSIAVSDAHPMVKQKSHYITKNIGGKGAVREVCDLILLAQNKL